jgi:hypothetical protein
MGVFQAVRNQAHHSIGDGEPVQAFEDLVALSKVARWVAGWRVERYYEPPEPINIEQITALSEALARTPRTTAIAEQSD